MKKELIFLLFFYSSKLFAQFVPIAVWNKAPGGPCSGSPSIGTVCTGGAIYAGTFDGGSYMITPGNCTDSSTPTCNGSTDSLNKVWRGTTGSSVDISGVENVSLDIFASSSSFRGDVNTPAIAADASISSDSAADYCNDMDFGGFTDWALPSKSELAYIYCKANVSGGSHNSSFPDEDANCASQGGKTSMIPGFSASSYWASTEMNATFAWNQNFSNGDQGGRDKSSATRRVRCIRRY